MGRAVANGSVFEKETVSLEAHQRERNGLLALREAGREVGGKSVRNHALSEWDRNPTSSTSWKASLCPLCLFSAWSATCCQCTSFTTEKWSSKKTLSRFCAHWRLTTISFWSRRVFCSHCPRCPQSTRPTYSPTQSPTCTHSQTRSWPAPSTWQWEWPSTATWTSSAPIRAFACPGSNPDTHRLPLSSF